MYEILLDPAVQQEADRIRATWSTGTRDRRLACHVVADREAVLHRYRGPIPGDLTALPADAIDVPIGGGSS